MSIGVPVEDLLADPDNPDWPGYSIEFCGGTHLAKTGDAEEFCVTHEEAVAKGVRRLTALTGNLAHQATSQGERLLGQLSALASAEPAQLAEGIGELTAALGEHAVPALMAAEIRDGIAGLQKKMREHQKSLSREAAGNVVEQARQIAEDADGGLIVATIEGADGKTLLDAMDVLKKKCPDAALLLGAAAGDKCAFLAAVPKPMIDKGLKAGDWVREVAKAAGGGGGGRPDMAQAGGKDVSKLEEALEVGRAIAQEKI